MELKKIAIGGKMLNVVSYDGFCQNKKVYNNTLTAVETKIDGQVYVLPVRNLSDERPGIYPDGSLNFFKLPDNNKEDDYSEKNLIDFGNSKNIVEVMEKQSIVRDIEREILTSPDNIFKPVIGKKDSPVMAGLKQAVIEKNIDIDKYQDRFPNFPNDKRLFKGRDITLNMLDRLASALDISVTLTLKDSSPDVPNPIGRDIVISLNGIEE